MTNIDHDLNLARAKFEYCAKLYQNEGDNFEYCEKKAQLFFSFIAIFLGAIILNADFADTARQVIQSNHLGKIGNSIFCISLGLLVISVFSTLIAIARSIRGQYWQAEHPDNVAFSLYAPNSKFLEKQDEITFLNTLGYGYALAIEHNRKINHKKSMFLEVATYSG